MFDSRKLLSLMPPKARARLDPYLEALGMVREMRDPRVLRALLPSALRGLLLHRGKQGVPTRVPAHHATHFDWSYPADQPAMAELYRRAKQGQWDGADLPWGLSVDPVNPEVPLLPDTFVDFAPLEARGIRLDADERRRFLADFAAWMLSQFLHGEQGALFAAAQVTEAVQFFDGKLYGATQVMDEGRHVEVFHRYLDQKLQKLYQINDNLFVIIDALMSDGRWDMKFLGMQIMVEGLALGAFGTLYRQTREPLLRELLARVIQDEARHVHYGVLALREQFTRELSERERQEREDWAFEVALLMRDRFMAYELYDEWFGGRMSRAHWRDFVQAAPGFEGFRQAMLSRILPRYEEIGLMRYFGGASADHVTAEQLLTGVESPLESSPDVNFEGLAAPRLT